MSKPRTIQEINNDYFQTAAMLGDLFHKFTRFTGENPYDGQIGELNAKLSSIDREADLAQKLQEKTKSNGSTKVPTSPSEALIEEPAQVQ